MTQKSVGEKKSQEIPFHFPTKCPKSFICCIELNVLLANMWMQIYRLIFLFRHVFGLLPLDSLCRLVRCSLKHGGCIFSSVILSWRERYVCQELKSSVLTLLTWLSELYFYVVFSYSDDLGSAAHWQRSLANAVTVSSSQAHAGLPSGRTWEGLPASWLVPVSSHHTAGRHAKSKVNP